MGSLPGFRCRERRTERARSLAWFSLQGETDRTSSVSRRPHRRRLSHRGGPNHRPPRTPPFSSLAAATPHGPAPPGRPPNARRSRPRRAPRGRVLLQAISSSLVDRAVGSRDGDGGRRRHPSFSSFLSRAHRLSRPASLPARPPRQRGGPVVPCRPGRRRGFIRRLAVGRRRGRRGARTAQRAGGVDEEAGAARRAGEASCRRAGGERAGCGAGSRRRGGRRRAPGRRAAAAQPGPPGRARRWRGACCGGARGGLAPRVPLPPSRPPRPRVLPRPHRFRRRRRRRRHQVRLPQTGSRPARTGAVHVGAGAGDGGRFRPDDDARPRARVRAREMRLPAQGG